MKIKNEHFWLLIFAVNFASFQLVQDYIRPQYAGDSNLIRYFLGVAPNFFPAVGIPSLFMVLLPILFSGNLSSRFILKRHLTSNLISVTGLVCWEILQFTGKLVFDWHDIVFFLNSGSDLLIILWLLELLSPISAILRWSLGCLVLFD